MFLWKLGQTEMHFSSVVSFNRIEIEMHWWWLFMLSAYDLACSDFFERKKLELIQLNRI